MEALEWISTREPRPPAALLTRMSRALHDSPEDAGGSVASRLLAAATGILRDGPGADRAAALDLLAADALITYAMESASDDCESIDAVAGEAVRAICDLR